MDGCRDKRFENLLHAYELGLLSEPDREELELHLMECESCLARTRSFLEPARLLRYDPDLQEAACALDSEESDQSATVSWWKRSFAPAFVVVAVVLLALILKPWHIQIDPNLEAVAGNRLAIMYFDDLTDPENTHRRGEIAANLLITDLSDSRYMQVTSSQRIHDILRLIGRDSIKTVDENTATQVAQQTNAKWMLMGCILQIEPIFVITTQLVDVASGDVLASRRFSGEKTDDIFAMVDRLTKGIKGDLSLPQEAQQEPDRRVAEVTTNSPTAYLYYIEGLDLHSKYYIAEARQSFHKAIEYDSTFAMAYYHLARMEDRIYLGQAVEYAGKVTRRERYYINSLSASVAGDRDEAISQLEEALKEFPEEKTAHFQLAQYKIIRRNYDEAIGHLKRAIEIDPLYKTAYNKLAYFYSYIGDLENAILAVDKYVTLAPEEPNPYDSRGDIYSAFGRLDKGIDSYKQALSIKPDFWSSLQKLGNLFLYKREFDKADSCFRVLAETDNPYLQANARYNLGIQPVHRAEFNKALDLFDQYIADDSMANNFVSQSVKHFQRARIYVELEAFDKALSETELCIDKFRKGRPSDSIGYRNYYIQILAEAGRFEQARQLADELKSELKQIGRSLDPYWYATGAIAFAEGRPEEAVNAFEKITVETIEFPVHFMLGRAYQQAGRLSDAVVKYEEQVTVYSLWRLCWGIWFVKMHYYMGLAYEDSRWNDKAIEQYTIFLSYWENADSNLPEIEDARKRLARLQNMP
ncbi:MAG: tetratricopeptide repeat protein [FCB group bacterium]|nr:tetratricopeptide repeat protein [FCB group bacterium]